MIKTNWTIRHYPRTGNRYYLSYNGQIVEQGIATAKEIRAVINEWIPQGTWVAHKVHGDPAQSEIWMQ